MNRFSSSLLAAALALALSLPAASQVRTQAAPANSREALTRADIRTDLAEHVRGRAPSAAVLNAHEIEPANVRGVTSDEGEAVLGPAPPLRLTRPLSADQIRAVLASGDVVQIATPEAAPERTAPGRVAQPQRTTTPARPGGTITAAPPGPQLDVGAFTAALHSALKDDVNGYVMRLRQNGQTISTLQWNWARRPGDGNLGWTPQRRMHVASVSKLVTAIATVDLLHDKGISYDAPIGPYLPTYWKKGSNVNQITFRDLLRHTSGIEVPGSSTSYATMRQEIAAGVPMNGSYQYENVNFALLRVLIPIINGDVSKDLFSAMGQTAAGGGWADQIWDAVTISNYVQYVQSHVFAPAGVNGPSLTHGNGDAIAYGNPWASGWNSGNLASVSGGAGWVMSVDQMLGVMDEYRRGGGIVPPSVAADAIDARLGLDTKESTPAGTLYNKNGLWRDGSGRTEQSLAYFLPHGMELVVFTNSPVSQDGVFFRTLVTDLYVANVK